VSEEKRQMGFAFWKMPSGTRILENAGGRQSRDSIEHRGLQNRAKRKLFGEIFAFFPLIIGL
jgi:hypothetical protein